MKIVFSIVMLLVCVISCGAEKKTRTQIQAEKNNKKLKWTPVANICTGPNCSQQYKITPNCSRTRELSLTLHPQFKTNERDLEVMWKMHQMQKR